MYCSQCGAKLPDNAKFCYKCGAKIEIPEWEEAQQVPAEEAPQQPAIQWPDIPVLGQPVQQAEPVRKDEPEIRWPGMESAPQPVSAAVQMPAQEQEVVLTEEPVTEYPAPYAEAGQEVTETAPVFEVQEKAEPEQTAETETFGYTESVAFEEPEKEETSVYTEPAAETYETAPYAEIPETDAAETVPETPAEEMPVENADLVKPEISFPLSQHRSESVCNLVFTIYSRGKLLTKSTGGDFYASDELVEELEREMLRTVDKVVAKIHDMGEDALHGLSFQDGKVVFDGFPGTDDPLTVKAWTALSAAINRAAIKQIHVRPKEVDDTNEKYSFRTWLTRLNMNGSELKAERNIFYKNLSGHTAFRTPADEEKWKARQKAKREAAKAERTEEDYGAEY